MTQAPKMNCTNAKAEEHDRSLNHGRGRLLRLKVSILHDQRVVSQTILFMNLGKTLLLTAILEDPSGTSPLNGKPSMYANSFSSVDSGLSKDSYHAKFAAVASSISRKDKYGMASTSPYPAKAAEIYASKKFKSVSGFLSDSPESSPSGASANCLNSFELAQRNIIRILVNQPRESALCEHVKQPVSTAFSQSNKYRLVREWDICYYWSSLPYAYHVVRLHRDK